MPRRQMWMGLRGRERWVPAPASGMDNTPVGWSSQASYLNGGTGVASSFASHREYQPSWNAQSRDALRPLQDMAHGLHGTGPVYFIDPTAADKNVLPIQWSAPHMASLDGPVLFGTRRPTSLATQANDLDYPFQSVQYRATTVRSFLYVPIPPASTAWFGWHGTANGTGGVEVTPIVRGGTSAPVVLPAPLGITDPTRVNTSFSGDTYQGLELRFGGGTATVANIAGMMLQILKPTATPQKGGFISGQGHSGCRFEKKVSGSVISVYAGVDGLVTASAKLIETGDWEQ